MFFGLHPLRVESVAWVAERKDVLSAFFFMLTLWAYVRYSEESKGVSPNAKVAEEDRPEYFPRLGPLKPREEGDPSPRPSPLRKGRGGIAGITNHARRYYALTLLLFVLGLMSKPMLVTLPFILILLDYWPLRRFPISEAGAQQSDVGMLRRSLTEKIPFFLLAAIVSVITIIVQKSGGAMLADIPLAERVGNAL